MPGMGIGAGHTAVSVPVQNFSPRGAPATEKKNAQRARARGRSCVVFKKVGQRRFP